jgi:hypothetical protein
MVRAGAAKLTPMDAGCGCGFADSYSFETNAARVLIGCESLAVNREMIRPHGFVTLAAACWMYVGAVAEGMRKIGYAGYRFPPEVIHQAIWLYLRFTLSFRDPMSFSNGRAATIGSSYLSQGGGESRKARSESSLRSWSPMLLALREAPPTLLRRSATTEYGSARRDHPRGTPPARRKIRAAIPAIFSARDIRTGRDRWHADFEAGVGPK